MRFLIFVFFLSFIPFTWAQDEDRNALLEDKFYFEAGIFIPQKSIKVGASGESEDSEIDFDQTFGFNDNQISPFLNLEWRWNTKWRLALEGFGVNNGAKAVLEEDIVFDGITFEKGSSVKVGVDIAIIRVFVGRIISMGQKHSLGAGLGVHAMNIGAYIEADINTSEGDLDEKRGSVNGLIPLPNIGGWYHWAPTPKWGFVARVDWFGITIDQYSGGLWDIAPGVKYQIIKNFGVGLDYRFFFLNARVTEGQFDGKFTMDFSGPLLTLHANF